MQYSYQRYFYTLFLYSLAILVLAIFFIAIGAYAIYVNAKATRINLMDFFGKILFIAVAVFIAIQGVIPLARHGIHLIKEKEIDKIECSGTITDIKEMSQMHKYTFDGQTSFSSYIFIDGERYYVMYTGSLEIGDEVSFEYLPKSKIILSIDEK